MISSWDWRKVKSGSWELRWHSHTPLREMVGQMVEPGSTTRGQITAGPHKKGFSRRRDCEAGTAPGVRAACWRFLQQARGAGWQSLWVGTGIWLRVAVCAESFVVDLVGTLERRRPEAAHWHSRIVNGMWEWSIRAVRRCEPGLRAWRQRAMRTDAALLERCCSCQLRSKRALGWRHDTTARITK